MYVAMTRARKNLYVSFYEIPSRFLSELPNELLELQNGGLNFDEADSDEAEERSVYWD